MYLMAYRYSFPTIRCKIVYKIEHVRISLRNTMTCYQFAATVLWKQELQRFFYATT